LLAALKGSGIDVVSTANNHSLDRLALGADRTLDALDEAGLKHTGTRRKGSQEPWHAITEKEGFRIAWIACTFDTTWDLPDRLHQVLNCYRDTAVIEKLIADLLTQAPTVDAVIVTPHWGIENATEPTPRDRALAHRFLEAGALAVIGSHPHVLQPWEKYVTQKDHRETFILNSLGNFVSGQTGLHQRTTILLNLGLVRQQGRVVISGVTYVPLSMQRPDDGAEDWSVIPVDATSTRTARWSYLSATNLFGTANLQPLEEPFVFPGCEESGTSATP
jgi:poly-gamma-glutamate capsule biosynthesis protein CapA/YwtB (metallophosphatase superfamily)